MKYAKLYRIGRIHPQESRVNKEKLEVTMGAKSSSEKEYLMREASIKNDFATLRHLAASMGYFKPSYVYFLLQAIQIIGFHVLGYFILLKYGCSIVPLSLAVVFLVIAQVEFKCFFVGNVLLKLIYFRVLFKLESSWLGHARLWTFVILCQTPLQSLHSNVLYRIDKRRERGLVESQA